MSHKTNCQCVDCQAETANEVIAEIIAEEKATRSYMVEVIADRTGNWCGNGLRFKSEIEAKEYAEDLLFRWTAVKEWRVMPSKEEPNR